MGTDLPRLFIFYQIFAIRTELKTALKTEFKKKRYFGLPYYLGICLATESGMGIERLNRRIRHKTLRRK